MPRVLLVLVTAVLLGPGLVAADQAEREATRFNEAVTKLTQTRDEAHAAQKAKSLAFLIAIAKSRMKAEDTAGATEAWRAILVIDREHADARTYFTTLGTLDAVLAELDAKPTDLLGLGAGEPASDKPSPDKPDKPGPDKPGKSAKKDAEKAP